MPVFGSGHYQWRKRLPSNREKDNERLLEQIKEVYHSRRRVYGSPRITVEINGKGTRCGKNRVARIMKANRIRAEIKRGFRRTTDSKHGYALAANLLIHRRQTERLWASDITFIPTHEGWLYVSAIMNVESRKIIGLSMSNRLSEELTAAALKQAVARQKLSEGVIHIPIVADSMQVMPIKLFFGDTGLRRA